MPGSPNTMNRALTGAAGVSERPRCRPFLTRCLWRRRRSWLPDDRTTLTTAQTADIVYQTKAELMQPIPTKGSTFMPVSRRPVPRALP